MLKAIELRGFRGLGSLSLVFDGGGGGTGGIFLGFELHQLADEVGGAGTGLQRDFVIDAPANDGGMVVTLADHFAELLETVRVKRGRDGDVINQRNLAPDNEAVLVGEVDRFPRCARNGKGGWQWRRSLSGSMKLVTRCSWLVEAQRSLSPILVQVDAVQIIVQAIEKKSVCRVHAEPAKAEHD